MRGIYYFSTELKRKLMSSQGAALSNCQRGIEWKH